ncbi:cation acetate symporter [Solihabitans fulvus]|uniref:Cation acetate symporter n=1 Tax=Solihabitans fulvus TaxID=1892852 RepID=A0A5B2XFV7_9PSEU|nr:cation acetate symporter [Solihabitans fulvus]KAA2262657.1 cation acetate symporter [Solihabitans fulvus]
MKALNFAAAEPSHRGLTIGLFAAFVVITVGITVWSSRKSKRALDFYDGGRAFSGLQNGIAISGDYMSAASFLGIAGMIALSGYDGFLYSIGFLVAWLVALLLVAELLRNSGRYTMADVLALRLRQRPIRAAAGVSTIVVSIFYLVAQMVGAGSLVSLLLGVSGDGAKIWVIVAVGALMIFYVTVGGMKGTTWVQIVKAVLLMVGAAVMTVMVLAKFNFNIGDLLSAAASQSGKGDAFLQPGLKYGATDAWSKIDLISLGIALVLGTAGLPHVLVRFYTVPDSKTVRKSVNWAIAIIGVFYLMTLAIGFGAAALVGTKAIKTADPSGNTAAPTLAETLGGGAGTGGGAAMLAFIASVAFATILAVVAGLTLASSSSVAHDLYANVFRRGPVEDTQVAERKEVRVAKVSAFFIGAIAIGVSIYARELNVAFLVAVAFAIAASANLPAILLTLFWKRFTTFGAKCGIYAGLIAAVGLVLLSPVCWGGTSSGRPAVALTAAQATKCGVAKDSKQVGNATALFSCTVKAPFPLENPGVVSIPIGFLAAIAGSLVRRNKREEESHADLEVRALTGVGAE